MVFLPITEKTHNKLAQNNADDFHVGNSGNPVLGAGLVFCPAVRPDGVEESGKVTNREDNITFDVSNRLLPLLENLPFKTHSGTGQHSIAYVPRERAERIRLRHSTNGAELSRCLGCIRACNEGKSL